MSGIASCTHGYVKEQPPCMIKFRGRRKRAKEKNKKSQKKSDDLKPMNKI